MKKTSSYQSGLYSEFLARWFLRFHGFSIIKSRHITGRHTGKAEIDIIARRGNLTVFTEVKSRQTIESAFEAISFLQRQRLRRAAETFIARTSWRGNARFDVIIICGWKIYWAKNVF